VTAGVPADGTQPSGDQRVERSDSDDSDDVHLRLAVTPAAASATATAAAVISAQAESEAVRHEAEAVKERAEGRSHPRAAPRSDGGVFRSLRVRNYRLYFTGNVISQVGTWMNRVAQDWLVLQLTGDDAVALGIATALQFGPVLLLSLFAGTVADRYDKRTLLIWLQVILGSAGVALGLLATLRVANVWHVYAICLVVGIAATFDGPVRQAFVMELVGPKEVTNAVALNSMGFNGARIVGPAVAGVLIAVTDSGPVMVLAGLGYIGVIVGLARMRTADLHAVERAPRAKGQIREGLRYVARRRDLMLVMMLLFLVATFGMNFQLTLAIMAKIVFHKDASSYGLLTTTLAIGSLLGALVSARRQGAPRQRLLIGSALCFGALEIWMGLTGRYELLAVLLVPTGILMLVFVNAANAMVQLTTEPAMRGRVMSIYTLAFLGGTPFISPVLGVLAEHFGGGAPLLVGGIVSAAAAIVLGSWIARSHHVQVELRIRPIPHVHLANPLAPDEENISASVAQSMQAIAGSARRTVRPAAAGMRRAGRVVRRGVGRPGRPGRPGRRR
jgi:MFS family permease